MRYDSIDQLPPGIRAQIEKQTTGNPARKADMPEDPPEKDPAARLRGLANREAGLQLEAMLSAGCEHYALHQIAQIQKTPEPMAVIDRLPGNRFIAVFTEKAQCDYKGTLAGGRSIVFEAKHTSAGQIKQEAVTGKQDAWLAGQHQLGALCFVMVSMDFERFYRVPFRDWRGMKRLFGHKYMTLEELEPYEVPLGLCDAAKGGRQSGIKFLQGLCVEVRG